MIRRAQCPPFLLVALACHRLFHSRTYDRPMSESKAVILGVGGLELTADEKALYRDVQPWGFILFGRNIGEANQISDLVASLRDTVHGNRHAPVLIDQEGGRVQRIREPICPRYPSGADLGAIY